MISYYDKTPVRVNLSGDKDVASTYTNEAKKVLFELHQINTNNKAIKTLTNKLDDGTVISASMNIPGLHVINIYTPPNKEDKKKFYWELVEEIRSKNIVAIINCDDEDDYDVGRVCFEITKDGWGEIIDWTNEINYESEDPVAPYSEQETFRKEWYDVKKLVITVDGEEKTETTHRIKQCKRVDAGYYAYNGSPLAYEQGWGDFATQIDTYSGESIDHDCTDEINSTLSIEPGPCPLEPYNDWSWFGENTEYSGLEETYVTFWTGGTPPALGTCSYWWPEEFLQTVYFEKSTVEGFRAWVYDSGPTFYYREAHFKETEDYNSFLGFPSDNPAEGIYLYLYQAVDSPATSYPYLNTGLKYTIFSDIGEILFPWNYGIYIEQNFDYYIFGARHYSNYEEYWYAWSKDERFPADHDRFADFESLTTTQQTILEGNSDQVYDPPFSTSISYYTPCSASYSEGHYPDFSVGVYCEDKFYAVCSSYQMVIDNIWESENDVRKLYIHTTGASIQDMGIFTMDEGWKEFGDEIKPELLVYAFACPEDPTFGGSEDIHQIYYGVLFKGKLGDREIAISPAYQSTNINGSWKYATFPDFDGKSLNESQLYGNIYISIGTNSKITKKYKKVYIDV